MNEIAHFVRPIIAFCREDGDVLLSTFFGGMGGVYVGFLLERVRDKKRIIAKRYYAINKALFALFSQWNVLVDFDKNALAEHRDKPDRWRALPVMLPGCKYAPCVDTESLLFLLEEPFCPNLLAELSVAQNNIQNLVEMIAYRDELRRQVTDQALERVLNPRMENELQVIGEELFSKVPAAVKSVFDFHDRLYNCWLKVYPKQRPISFSLKEEGTS